jgi:hypothetical protein
MILHEPRRRRRRSMVEEDTKREKAGVRNKELSRKDRASRNRNILTHLKS